MKKLLTMVLAAVSCSLAAQELTLQFSGAELIVNASRLTAMTALQFNLELPEGVTIADSDVTMGEATDGHTLCMETLAGSDRLFILYNINLNTFKDGELLRIPIIINNDGVAKLYKVRFADTEAKSYIGSDASAIVAAVASLNITADDQTREYGEANPVWTYTVTDGEIYGDGQPTLSCEATSKSPVGTYVIAIEKGTVQNPATLTKGTLTITKAPLTVTAGSYTMKQVDPLPSFDVSYEGFKNGETASVLTTQPIITCTATSASVPGTYDIKVSGAAAQNYEISYVRGTLTIEPGSFTLTYVVDGETYKTVSYDFGENITPEEEPTKMGYTFSGWSWIPSNMPAEDVTVTGTFTVNNYTLTYVVDGETYKTVSYDYGESITPEKAPTKVGYTFSGWSEVPETMPADDVTVTGTFTVNKYTLTYVVDGETYKTVSYDYGESITPEPAPSKEGYTFSGWSEVPETMPAKDVTVTGTFTANQYKLIYKVDGETYKTVSYDYGESITPEKAPTKVGYTFSGWSWIPSKMPAEDVTVTGTFTVNKYKLTYMVDGQTYKTYEMEYGSPVTAETVPTKEGYTFSGWSWIPSNMPANDVTVIGTFTVNKYKLTYMVDGQAYKDYEVEYGAKITPEPQPEGDYISFVWTGLPETMPAKDVTVQADYTTGINGATLNDNVQTRNDKWYDLKGRRLSKPKKGVNILRDSSGKIHKVVVK